MPPGSPSENGFTELFNSRFLDKFLKSELFTTALEAQILFDRWVGSTTHSGRPWFSTGVRPWSLLNRESCMTHSSTLINN